MKASALLNSPLGQMSSTAYDTAWVALLNHIDPVLSNNALSWLCENQLEDGSWGSLKMMYYHDRVACTLAAMLALVKRGRRAADRLAIERGLIALEQITSGATQGLMAEANGATAGFEMIIPSLVKEAEDLGIIKQQSDRILGRLQAARQAKMKKLEGLQINRHYTAALSAEMAGQDFTRMLQVDELQEDNGSVANSPSATAYFLDTVKPGDERALKYIRQVVAEDGGAPFVAPFECFELAWLLWNLTLVDENLPLCKERYQYLRESWKPGEGIGFSRHFSMVDGDDTAVVFELSKRLGVAGPDLNAVLKLEETDHFRCFPLETSFSTDVNIHVVAALRAAGMEPDHPSILKALRFIRQTRIDNALWLDKWHVSPFYTTAHVVICCAGMDDRLCAESVNWILGQQIVDGSWGYYRKTAEETAFCLQALCFWRKRGGDVRAGAIEMGKRWLEEHAEGPYPPLWIGKSLYCPDLLVRAAICSALQMAIE